MNQILNKLLTQRWAMDPIVLSRAVGVVNLWTRGALKGEAGEEYREVATALRLTRSSGRWSYDDESMGDGGQEPAYRMAGNVAVVPVSGMIARHASMVNGASQPKGMSSQRFIDSVRRAATASRKVLLDVDSPGGTFSGLAEAQAAVDELVASGVNVVAIARDTMASGAYWLACRCTAVYAVATADVGSIGVYRVIEDTSAALAAEGVVRHLVASGPHKGAGEPGTGLTETQLQGVVEDVVEAADLFASVVAEGRGLNAAQMQAVTDGRCYGAERAMSLGLIDGITTLEDLIAAMQAA